MARKKVTVRSVLRWTLRIVLGSVALVILVAAIAIGAIHTKWGRDRVRREIEAQLQDDFPGSTVGRLDGSPFGTLTATGITIAGKGGKPFITVESAELGVQLRPLLGKTIHVDTVTLHGVLVDLAAQPDKKKVDELSTRTQPETPAKPSSWDIEVPTIIVRDARVLTAQGERLDGIDLDASVRLAAGKIIATAGIKAAFRGQPFEATASVAYGPPSLAGAAASAASHVDAASAPTRGSVLDVPFAHVKLGPAELTVIGAHAVLDGPLAVDGTIVGHAPASLAKQLGQKDAPGDVAFVVHSKGGNIAFDASLDWLASVSPVADPQTAKLDPNKPMADPKPGPLDPNRPTADPKPGSIVAPATQPSLADSVTAGASSIAVSGGRTRVRGYAHLDLSKLDLAKTDFTNLDSVKASANLVVVVDDPRGRASFAISGSPDGARGLVAADGRYSIPITKTNPRSKKTSIEMVDIEGGALVPVDVERKGDAWNLVSALVLGEAATKLGKANASVAIHGTLTPKLALDAGGFVDVANVKYEQTRVARAQLHFDAKDVTGEQSVTSHVEVDDVRQGALAIPRVEIATTVKHHADGSLDIDLGEHRVVTADGKEWTGHGGHVSITDATIDARDLQTGTANSTVVASAKLGRLTKDIAGSAHVRNVSLAMLDPKLRGTVGGDLRFAQKAGSYSGKGSFDGKGIVVPGKPALDGHVGLELAGRRVKVDASASTIAGGGHIAFEVEGPRDITDPLGWKRLERSALKNLTIGVTQMDLSRLGLTDPKKDPTAKPLTGVVDGELVLGAKEASGSLHVGGVATSAGTIDTTLSLKPGASNAIDVHVDSALSGVKPATVDATFTLPKYVFDPDAWAALGKGALQYATIRANHIQFDPSLLARFGITKSVEGTVDATVEVASGVSGATLAVDVTNVRGAQLRAPVVAHFEAGIDAKGTTASANANMGNVGIALTAKSPLTMAGALAGMAKTAGLDVTLTLPTTKATQILALLGRQDLTDGQVGGSITVGGTVARPVVVANFSATNLTPPPTIATKKPAKMEKLDIAARWTAGHAELEVTGFETGGHLLKISGRGDVDSPKSVAATIEAASFDIAPLVAFAPGALGAARGTLDGVIKVNGLDPQTGDVRGQLHLTEGRLPLAPTIGTLRKADVVITIAKQELKANLSAKLGAGTITGTAGAALVGGVPKTADFDLALRKISPIGAVQPVIDADSWGHFSFEDGKVKGKINVRKGNVYVPPEEGNELIDTTAPSDMFFVGKDGAIVPKPIRKQAQKPWLFCDIDIATTKVYVDDKNFLFDGTASGQLHLEVGQGLTLEGSLSTEHGAVDVLGRRYQLDHGIIDFEGTLDPRLDIRLIHDFKTMSLTVDIGGTLLVPDPRLKGDPGSYTEGQLFAFLAGADPDDSDTTAQAGAAVSGAASVLVSSRIGRKINKYLPFKLDTLNYETGTASSSSAVRAGIRLSDKSHLLWRQRLDPRPDENPGEAVFEYVIKPWALVEATGGERASGGDILLRKRW